jgi:hypothetical protein
MKKLNVKIAVMAVCAGLMMSACGGVKQLAQQSVSPAVVAEDMPCFTIDDEEWYTGTVARRRPAGSINTLATACLRAARQNLQQKIKGQLKQVTRDYFDQMDIDEGSTEASHIESAGDNIVNQFMNDMMETCRKVTPPVDGYVIMYMGVKISKKALVDNLATGLSRDKQLEKRFDEKVFREDALKVFKEDKQQSFDDYKNAQD